MKTYKIFALIISIVMSISACTAQGTPANSSEESQAAQALTTFLAELHNGQYAKASEYYGGSYDTMMEQNPMMAGNDHESLLKNACTVNGAVCLAVKSVTLEKMVSANEYEFKVEYQNEDGTLFVQGPCCGGNETDSPSQSMFFFTVSKNAEGKFMVMDMPPYMP